MVYLFTTLHIIVCVFLVIVVLLQSGKAADLAGAFGGMGSQTAFGPRGAATVLSKATTIAAGLFMVTSLTLAVLASKHAGGVAGASVLDKKSSTAAKTPAKTTAPPPAASTPAAGTPTPVGAAGQKSDQPTPIRVGQPGDPLVPGAPSVTLTPEGGGPSQTLPVYIPKPGQTAPAATPAAPKK
ncbi:MAG TPA: preprotein translocase subunit SecG [Bryobacteraceae bacterium]|nr:preprotein translocase subunit SecG [Bryobacteraceae bacterium]